MRPTAPIVYRYKALCVSDEKIYCRPIGRLSGFGL